MRIYMYNYVYRYTRRVDCLDCRATKIVYLRLAIIRPQNTTVSLGNDDDDDDNRKRIQLAAACFRRSTV